MIPKEKLEEIIENFGKNGDKSWFLLHEYSQYVAEARDENGKSLLCHAIRMNDGGNVATLIQFGADIHAATTTGDNTSNYEYAKKYATYKQRKPYAFEAIESFKKIKDTLKVEILYDYTLENSSELTKQCYESAKNKKDDELVSLYHGANFLTISDKAVDSFSQAFVDSNCLKQISGPTLSLKPIGQFWRGLGLEIKIPRNKIEFPGEKKDNPVVEINEDGIAFIITPDKSIKFDEFHTKPLLNLFCCKEENKVIPTYASEEGCYESKFNLDAETITALNTLQYLMSKNDDIILKKDNHFTVLDISNGLSNMKKIRESSMPQVTVGNSCLP